MLMNLYTFPGFFDELSQPLKFLSTPEQTLIQGSGPVFPSGVFRIFVSPWVLASRTEMKIGSRSSIVAISLMLSVLLLLCSAEE